ncbi:MAG: O-antigen ligase domain-containing protein [Planctomycetota bacterium]|nr:MAG: O-antigen ligase domain-containing protein [Planctomycetota bacterium]
MKPRRNQPKSNEPASTPTQQTSARVWLLAAFVAVCVARPLVPSEGVAWLGDGHPFTIVLLILTAGYLLLVLRQGHFARRFHFVDAAAATLVGVSVVSAALAVLVTLFASASQIASLVAICSPRPTLNMLWEWVGFGLVFLLARHLIVTALETRVVVAIMIALAVALSLYGFYQVAVELPAERAAYAENPDEVLRSLGQWYPPGSPERARFEDRLASTEPLATFALTNSLAGVLAPWLIVLLGVSWGMLQARLAGTDPGRMPTAALLRAAGLLICIAALLVCVVLSKSRSAYVALAAGLVMLPFALDSFRRLFAWRAIAALALVFVAAFGYAVATGGVDAEVLTEASKSLEYRVQYWEATLDMIAEHPIVGVAPGNFQNYYTQYKLPEASEEIRDPHNFLLETWATGGTLAFFALIVLLAAFGWQTWQTPSAVADDATERSAANDALRLSLGGAAAGALFAFVIGGPFGFSMTLGQLVGIVASGGLTIAILWPWINSGTLPPRLPAVALLVLVIHLLAAGGFTFPGVAGTFWLLLALGLNAFTDPAPTASVATGSRQRLVSAVALVTTLATAAACYFTALLPVLTQRELMARATAPGLTDERRIELFLEAAAADPMSSEPWEAIAQLSLAHFQQEPTSDLWGTRFLRATTSIMALRGHSSAAWRELAAWYQQQYQADPNPELADQIVQLCRRAVELYPNSAQTQAQAALALSQDDQADAARKFAARALELDRLTPHADKKLSADIKAKLDRLLASDGDQPTLPPSGTVE